jgi:ribosomal subunit interface protein
MEDTMELTVKSRSGKVTERQRQHIDEKLNKLARYMGGINSATVEVLNEQLRSSGETYRVQVTLVGEHGVILRAEEQAADLFSAVDEVQQVLERQIKRYKEKYWRRGRGRRSDRAPEVEAEPTVAVAPPQPEDQQQEGEQPERVVIRTKQFSLRPMFVDDAIEQMELLGHNFFVFQDAESETMAVLYRRRDGNYGLIIPE